VGTGSPSRAGTGAETPGSTELHRVVASTSSAVADPRHGLGLAYEQGKHDKLAYWIAKMQARTEVSRLTGPHCLLTDRTLIPAAEPRPVMVKLAPKL
jgi:hypothetical protein